MKEAVDEMIFNRAAMIESYVLRAYSQAYKTKNQLDLKVSSYEVPFPYNSFHIFCNN